MPVLRSSPSEANTVSKLSRRQYRETVVPEVRTVVPEASITSSSCPEANSDRNSPSEGNIQ